MPATCVVLSVEVLFLIPISSGKPREHSPPPDQYYRPYAPLLRHDISPSTEVFGNSPQTGSGPKFLNWSN